MVLDRIFLGLLAFVPAALVAEWLGAAPLATFILAVAALVPLAKFLSDATESLAERAGPAVGGLLNATFGNAPELIVSVFALSAGLVDVVKASMIGSIIGNLLLGLGLALFCGGVGRVKQEFNITAARSNASTLLLAAAALVLPAVFFISTDTSMLSVSVEHLSLAVSVLLILGYAATLIFALHTHKHLYAAESDPDAASWSVGTSVTVLVVATAAVALVSDTLVGALQPLIATLGWSPLFVGAIVLAVAGNAAEYLSAIRAAIADKMALATQISLGSATQVLLFVIPVIVIASALLGKGVNLVFTAFELVAVVFAILVTNSIIEDGETNWLEGVLLLVLYLIIAAAFFFHA